MDLSLAALGLADADNGNSPSGGGFNILNLPEKCIINIIKHVPLQNMDDIIELFPKWDKIVQEYIPVEVHVTDIGFRIAHHYFMGHQDLAKYRIKIIHSRVLDEILPELKSYEDLEIVEFPTHTEPSTFKTLVCKAVNLRELQLGYGSITSHNLSEIDLNLPNLRVLSICDRQVEFKGSSERGKILPSNIVGFLGKSFPTIRDVSVITSAPRMQTIEYTAALLQFIQSHSKTLKNVKFDVMRALLSEEDNELSEIDDLAPIPSTPDEIAGVESVKLESLDIGFGQNFFVGLEQWTAILNNQRNLIDLTIGLEKPLRPALYIIPISLSETTLVSLRIGVEVYGKDQKERCPFDCSITTNCINLKKLQLIGPFPHSECSHERPPKPEVINVDKLPKTLASFKIENIYLETTQIKSITEEQTLLEVLSLKNVGVSEEFGVTIPLLDSWIKACKLKEIMLRGVNGKEAKMENFDHLVKLGLTSPLTKCRVHGIFYDHLHEYRKPRENTIITNQLFI